MRTLRWLPVPLALLAGGCILTSGQFAVDFDLGTVNVTSPTSVVGTYVDLNTVEDYNDHKDKLKDLSDLSLLGLIENNGLTAVDVVVYMTPDLTTFTDETLVKANGVHLWGPFHLGVGETKRIEWDTSAGLFTDIGKTTLVGEVKGDGEFTIYLLGAAGTYSFTVTEGRLVLILDAGV